MRLLVIVSTDYGELGNALCFLEGHAFATRPLLMLPPTLQRAVGRRDDLTVVAYDTLADIRRHTAAFAPDAVMLFSGYLLTIGRRFSLFNALRFLRDLRALAVPVFTSDPFLGLVGGPSPIDFAPVMRGRSAAWRRVRGRLVAWRIRVLGRQLRRVCHVYPAPIERLGRPGTGIVRRGYFNRAAFVPPAVVDPEAPPSWIFVLSNIDYQVQTRGGSESFVISLAARLREASAGRDVVLFAPPAALTAVRAALGAGVRVELRSSDGYPAFMSRLMAAEYAFFWNIYSFSLLHRVMAQRPVLFFAEGHMVEIMPALHDAGIALFYGGWQPPLLSLDEPLRDEAIAAVAATTRLRFATIAAGLQQNEDPATVLHSTVSTDQRNVLDAQA